MDMRQESMSPKDPAEQMLQDIRCKASAFPQWLGSLRLPHFPRPRRRNHLQTINPGVGPFYSIEVGPFYVVKARPSLAGFEVTTEEAAEARRALEGRKTTGRVLLP